MKADFGVALLLITHDLGVVAEMADRVAVMYAGRIVEESPAAAFFDSPQHPYSKGLLASLPQGGGSRRLQAIEGAIPSLSHLPPGCPFEPRCPDRIEACTAAVPPLDAISPERRARCIRLEGASR
jgi:oligopeptide/dipeptide ABC transporter ATP-binding protein